MMGNVYVMITTRGSNFYTKLALDSFFISTRLGPGDEVYLIDNDNEGTYNTQASVISNTTPQGFAKNVNNMIGIARGRTLIVLNNDVVFTPGWSDELTQHPDAIVMPSCNQTHLYTSGQLTLQQTMNLDEYNNQYADLCKIAQAHKDRLPLGFFERLLMGFYAFVLPAAVYDKVGLFDERFGVGGGEDVDYRIRAISHNFPVKYYSHSYLLHFAGKSTWAGPEHQQQINQRNQQYFDIFAEKWGGDLANLCLVGGVGRPVIEKYQLHELIKSFSFAKAIKVVLGGRGF
jgi:GT2 family glycosyltransferase